MTSAECVLTIGVSTRSLFNLEKENKIYETEGIEKYINYQIEHEEEILLPGVGLNLVKGLLKLNSREEMKNRKIEVVLLSRSCPDISIRIFNSLEHYGIHIERAIFTGGKPLVNYIKTNNIDLYLSCNKEDVKGVLNENMAAAMVYNRQKIYEKNTDEVRIAFDCDCVIFDSQSENIFKEGGLQAFEDNERKLKDVDMSAGPFKNFFCKLGEIQRLFDYELTPIRIAICTARNCPSHERVIKTFRSWGIRVNEAFFMGSGNKAHSLEGFNADIFFDDGIKHIERASEVVPSGQVLI